MSQTENSNQPKCIKHKRRNNFQDSESEYSSSGEDSSYNVCKTKKIQKRIK
jgi:hypothetical protein